MSEFKGTKYHWSVNTDVNYNESGAAFIDIDSYGDFEISLASVYGESDNDVKMKANALLISKAPEMLEFLIKLKKEWEEDDLRYGGENFHMEEITNLIKEATEI